MGVGYSVPRRGQGHNDYPTQMVVVKEAVGPVTVAPWHHIASRAPRRDDGPISPGLPAHLSAPGSTSLKVTVCQRPLVKSAEAKTDVCRLCSHLPVASQNLGIVHAHLSHRQGSPFVFLPTLYAPLSISPVFSPPREPSHRAGASHIGSRRKDFLSLSSHFSYSVFSSFTGHS